MDQQRGRSQAWLESTGEIASLASQLNLDLYDEFAAEFDALNAGCRGFFTGQGRSGLVARMAAMRFMHMNLPVHVVGEATAPSIETSDLLVVISGSGKTPVSMTFAQVALDVAARVLLITHQASSPLQEMAHATLVLPAVSSQFGGTLFEESALILLDSIVLDQMQVRSVPHELMARRHTNFL